MVPEVDSPELSHAYANKFISISVLRKVAHIHKRDDTVATDHVNVYTTKGGTRRQSRLNAIQLLITIGFTKSYKNFHFYWILEAGHFGSYSNKWGEALDIEDNFGSSFARKRLCILTKQPESILEKFKVIFKGKVFVARAKELFTWNPSFLEPKESVYTSDDECNVDGVSETIFSDNVDECNVDGHGKETDKHQSEDPFGFYDLLNKLPAKGVRDAWLSFSHSDSNAMVRFKKKLQDLKSIIRLWVKDKKFHLHNAKNSLQNDLISIDKDLERGNVSDDILLNRMDLNRRLQDIKLLEVKDLFQKSKIKWAIEGDENSKFFHGIIIKKGSQLSIRGVFVEGTWCTDPSIVKDAFKNHFEVRL
ncbi:hypothetical protein Tco_0622428, partial [Tanacetum coccineum]